MLFFVHGAGKSVNDSGKIVSTVTSLLGACPPVYVTHEGLEAPLEPLTRVASKEFGAAGISVNAGGPRPIATRLSYPADGEDAIDDLKTVAAL
jgi:NAD(P)-dependent dehydrogenase (short-subunit alcohol dehydrogenase family)